MNIVKTFSKTKTEQDILSGGITSFVTWEQLKPYLAAAVRIRHNEKVAGIVIEKDGITVRIEPNPAP